MRFEPGRFRSRHVAMPKVQRTVVSCASVNVRFDAFGRNGKRAAELGEARFAKVVRRSGSVTDDLSADFTALRTRLG